MEYMPSVGQGRRAAHKGRGVQHQGADKGMGADGPLQPPAGAPVGLPDPRDIFGASPAGHGGQRGYGEGGAPLASRPRAERTLAAGVPHTTWDHPMALPTNRDARIRRTLPACRQGGGQAAPVLPAGSRGCASTWDAGIHGL